MKTLVNHYLLIILLQIPTVSSANPEHKGPPNRDDIFKTADANKDSTLSLEEFSQLPKLRHMPSDIVTRIFGRLDTNNNGSIAITELPDKHRSSPLRPLHKERLKAIDTNSDHKVSLDEFLAAEHSDLSHEKAKKLFSIMDRDEDGFITPKDKPKRTRFDFSTIAEYDKDSDEKLSFSEFQAIERSRIPPPGILERHFKRLDKNHDGFISLEDSDRSSYNLKSLKTKE